MLPLVRLWKGFRDEEPVLKRILYLCALAFLVGVGISVARIAGMPNRMGDALDEAADHDPAARDDLDLAHQQNPEWNEYAGEGVFCLAGFAVCMTLARRAR
jgi:hypothetical protein